MAGISASGPVSELVEQALDQDAGRDVRLNGEVLPSADVGVTLDEQAGKGACLGRI